MHYLCKHICIYILTCIFVAQASDLTAQEICNNGRDDDGNELIDLHDPACQCRFTVNGNLLENASFESYDHCPVNFTYDEDYNISEHWQLGTYTNINEAYYYHNLQCAYDSSLFMSRMPPKLPLPNGDAFVGVLDIYSFIDSVKDNELTKSYIGQCLQSPLKKGESFTLSFYAGRFKSWDNLTGKIYPFTVAVFGNKDCNAVPFGKQNVLGNGCPSNYEGWVLLGETTIYSSGYWVQSKINFTVPVDINVIEIGPACPAIPPVVDLADSTTFLDYHQYYLDDLHLLLTKDFSFTYIHVKTGVDCKGLPILEAPFFNNATYQWYKDSIAIIGANADTYQVTDTEGKSYYNVLINTTDSCIISEPFLITATNLDELKIPVDTSLCAGDTLLLAPVIEGITYKINGTINTDVYINTPGSYAITASDVYGCEKVFNVNVAKQDCSDCNAYVPTAFTPDNDGLNDLFKPKFYCAISRFHLSIYNRWGKKIFETNDINKAWDGIYAGEKLPLGSYVYLIDYTTLPGVTKTGKGLITLIR